MVKKRIAILYGGRSVEHGVSINSARNIFEFIDRNRFDPIPIGICTEGKWFLHKEVTRNITSGQPLTVSADPAQPGFLCGNTRIEANLVFPVLHGTDGEDGSVQGLLQALGLPFVGSGVLGSALSMNKIVAKQLLFAAGIPVAPFVHIGFAQREQLNFQDLVGRFGLPFMVKSASLGSSVGVSKVSDAATFEKAVADAFSYDDEVIVEKFIKGREVECAILGNDPAEASLPGEIILSSSYEFYSFDAKYVDGEAVSIQVPAVIGEAESAEIRRLSLAAYRALRCRDFARVDLFLTPEGIYVNEINTIPGFTNSSMFPMMWKERGISFTDLISRLIDLAFDRNERENRIRRSFQSGLKY